MNSGLHAAAAGGYGTIVAMPNTKPVVSSIEMAMKNQPLFASAMKNNEFRNQFYNTLKDIGKNYYSGDNINKKIDEYYNEWEEYYYNNDKRFSNYSTDRSYSIIKIKEYFDKRYDYITKVG